MLFLEKPWKMLENIEILNLSQQKEGETLVSEPNHHATEFLTEKLFAIEMKKY